MQPEGGRQVGLLQESSGALSQSPVGPLSNTILVGLIPHSVLSGNASSSQEGAEGCRHVLSTLIVVQGLDFEPQRVLSPCLELLERLKRVRLALEPQSDLETRVVINKEHPVAVALWRPRHRAMEVGMDEF